MRLRLISELRYSGVSHVADPTPDTFYADSAAKAVPFIYDEYGTLHIGGRRDAHTDIMTQNAEYYGVLSKDPDYNDEQNEMLTKMNVNKLRYQWLQEYEGRSESKVKPRAMLGRTGWMNHRHYVAFWFVHPDMLDECLRALANLEIISDETIVVTPNGDRFTAGSKLSGQTPKSTGNTEPDPKRQRERELMQQLHLMRPQQKKAAMKELGLVGGGHKQPWQKAAEKAKLVQPGQKWWAMSSESVCSDDI